LEAFANQQCRSAHEQQQLLFQDPATEEDLQVAVAHGVLHSNICCAKDKTLLNLQTFEIYKHFSEEVLNSAFNKARADSLVVAVKRRNIQSAASRQITGPGHLLSSKYKYRLTYTKLTHVLYDSYFALDQKLRTDQEQNLTSPHFAQLLVMGECLPGSLPRRYLIPLSLWCSCSGGDKIVGNPIGWLQEMCMQRRWPPPSYETETEVGLPHERLFTIACSILNYREMGKGKSKKIAKRLAAHRMWMRLQDAPIDSAKISDSICGELEGEVSTTQVSDRYVRISEDFKLLEI